MPALLYIRALPTRALAHDTHHQPSYAYRASAAIWPSSLSVKGLRFTSAVSITIDAESAVAHKSATAAITGPSVFKMSWTFTRAFYSSHQEDVADDRFTTNLHDRNPRADKARSTMGFVDLSPSPSAHICSTVEVQDRPEDRPTDRPQLTLTGEN